MQIVNIDDDIQNYIDIFVCDCGEYGRQEVVCVEALSDLPEINPETLPIVQGLRKQIKEIEKELNVAVKDLKKSKCLWNL